MALTIGLLTLANAVPPWWRRSPARLVEASIALGLAAAALAVRRADGLGATLAAVTSRRDRQLAGKQGS